MNCGSKSWTRCPGVAGALLASLAMACGDVAVPLLTRLSSDRLGGAEAGAMEGGPADASGGPTDLDAAADADPDVSDSGMRVAGDGSAVDALAVGAFGPVSLVAPISDPNADDEDPTFTGDELELYFMSNRGGNQDIWVSRRPATTSPWGTPTSVPELNSPASEQGPAVALDGLTIWFSSNRDDDAGAGRDIWVSSRANTALPWGAPRPVPELSSSGTDEAPAIDEAELVIVFMSDRAGGVGGMDLYMSSRTSKSALWGPPVNLVDVNTPGDEWDPFIGDRNRQLFWGANRPKEEIRQSTRTSITQPFPAYRTLSELGTPDYDPTFSVDLRHIMFGSSRSGNQEIYEAFR